MTKIINAEVEVNAFYFAQGKNFKSFPKVITYENRRYAFRDGLQMLVHQGQNLVRLFDMTDGNTAFRLREEKDQWILIGMKPLG